MLPTRGRCPSPGRARAPVAARWGVRGAPGAGLAMLGAGAHPRPPSRGPWRILVLGRRLPWQPPPRAMGSVAMGTAPLFGSSTAAAAAPLLPPRQGRTGARGGARLQDDGWAANSPQRRPCRRAAGRSAGPLAARDGLRTGFWGRHGAKSRHRGAGLSVPGRSRILGCRRPAPRAPGSRWTSVPAEHRRALCPLTCPRVPASPRPHGPARNPLQSRAAGRPAHRCRRPSPAAAPCAACGAASHPAPPAMGRSLRGLAGRLPAAVG